MDSKSRAKRWILGVAALKEIALAGMLVACASAAQRAEAPTRSLPAAAPAAAVSVVSLAVTEHEMKAIVARGTARVTFEAERGAPIDYAAMGEKRNEERDPPGMSNILLTDRLGHVISMAGTSMLHPGDWEQRLLTVPTRTQEETLEDLAVARDASDTLLTDERVQRWFRWEIHSLRATAEDLLNSKAPTPEESEYSP